MARAICSFSGLVKRQLLGLQPVRRSSRISPAARAVTVNSANVSGISFTATSAASTFDHFRSDHLRCRRDGNAELPRLPRITTTADGTGKYSFTGLANGSYTVIPKKTGLIMTAPCHVQLR